jgi:hypothetical protein
VKELASLVEQNEPGCLSYNIFYNPNENTFLIVERFGTIEWVVEEEPLTCPLGIRIWRLWKPTKHLSISLEH